MFLFHSVICLVALCSSYVFANSNDGKEDRIARSDREGLWFGPRLGKRSLHLTDEDNSDVYYRLIEAADALKFYYNQLPQSYLERRDDPESRVTKKVIFTPKLGRSLNERHYADFTPRLGRRVVDAVPVTPADQDSYDAERIGARTRYFSPRLGRNMNFSPRLGRELSYDNYDNERVRVARSTTNNTRVTKR